MTDQEYKRVNAASELHAAISEWLQTRGQQRPRITMETVLPRGLAVPSPEYDSTVTIDEMVKWADAAYHAFHRYIGIPILYCDVSRDQVLKILTEKLERDTTIIRVLMRIEIDKLEPKDETDFKCSVVLEYQKTAGRLLGTKRLQLVAAATPMTVDGVHGSASSEYDIAGLFKVEGFGDWEDRRSLLIPAVRAVWSEINAREIDNALAYLGSKEREEKERSRLKIEFLGTSLDASTALVVTSIVVFSLQLLLNAHLMQIRQMIRGNEAAIRDSVFLGLGRSAIGFVMLVLTLLFFPMTAVLVDLILVLGNMGKGERGEWVLDMSGRWALVVAVTLGGSALIWHVNALLRGIRRWENRRKYV